MEQNLDTEQNLNRLDCDICQNPFNMGDKIHILRLSKYIFDICTTCADKVKTYIEQLKTT